jgi:outer membrane lipoprotein carrier protein
MQRRSFACLFIATFLIANYPINVPGSELKSLEILENFIKSTKSGKSDFTQTVTSPARDGQAPRVKTSTGIFEFQRPNRFKFHYKKPFEQLILADGTHLWIYDADLNQASQRKQADAFANTPAAIIASSSDLSALRAQFNLEAAPEKDGLQWVQAKPKSADSTLQVVRIGFKGEALQQLDITDSFGQRSVINFGNMQINPALPAESFRFNLPKGAEVIKQ